MARTIAEAVEKGRRGLLIAKRLWPQLVLVEEASSTDKAGQDAYFRAGNVKVQVKTDETMAETNNLYIELYEKTEGRSEQRWRHSPVDAGAYIFVTRGFAVIVGVDALANAIIGIPARQIRDTSIGFLLPLERFFDNV